MTALWIILGIVGFFTAILLIPLRVFMRYSPEGGMDVYAKILFFRLGGAGRKRAKPASAAKKSKAKKSASPLRRLLNFLGIGDMQSVSDGKRSASAKGIGATLNQILGILRALTKRARWLLGKCVMRRLDLRIIVADEDAADAAFDYGMLCAAVYPLIALLESLLRVKRRQVDILCDYTFSKTQVHFDGLLRLRLVHIVRLLLFLLWDYIRKIWEDKQS
ncbi:MAG: hypothetical protein LBM28_06645 [Oscillospiraceae bacterium]|jgi:hypothetical protein|nr:hypothetical protein [Oscillospiraceae bacterium]